MLPLIKKYFVSLLAIGALSLGVTYAASTLGDSLQSDTDVWSEQITVEGITDISATISLPMYTANNEEFRNYNVYLVEGTSMNNLADEELGKIRTEIFDAEQIEETNGSVKLTINNLVANTEYYYTIEPINNEGLDIGVMSAEKVFRTSAATTNTQNPNNTNDPIQDTQRRGPLPGTTTMLPSAGNANLGLTYVQSGSTVTLRWNDDPTLANLRISAKEITEANYSNLETVQISLESYSFTVDSIGDRQVRVEPLDRNGMLVGQEVVFNVKVMELTPPTGTGTPPTGPGLHLILMSTFLLMLMYVVYRFRNTQ